MKFLWQFWTDQGSVTLSAPAQPRPLVKPEPPSANTAAKKPWGKSLSTTAKPIPRATLKSSTRDPGRSVVIQTPRRPGADKPKGRA